VARVIGIDPGTVSIDVCGLDDGRLFLDESLPTRETLSDPARFATSLEQWGPVDLVAGPSGYGLPLRRARELTDADLRLAYLAADGDGGGIGGLRSLARAFAVSRLPVVFTPGVVHLPTVPAHRKVNRVDMGTADKLCAAALAIREQASRRGCSVRDVSLILLELGGAFSAAIAVERGEVVDGVGGTSGPMGMLAAGALDGEVAYLAGTITKRTLFGGGVAAVMGDASTTPEGFVESDSGRARIAWEAYIESAVKAVAALRVSAPAALTVVLSGRMAGMARVRTELTRRLEAIAPGLVVHELRGFASMARQAAQGAALIADGLAGGAEADLVASLAIEAASGTVLDHLALIPPGVARARLGIADA
jgi:predicted butyrate kinase (DUF1464 family)